MVCRRSLANLLATETALLTIRQQSADHQGQGVSSGRDREHWVLGSHCSWHWKAFSRDVYANPELSCSLDGIYKYLGSQLWALLSSERSKTVVKVYTQTPAFNEKTSQNPRRVAHCRVSSLVMVCRRSLANLLATETALLTRRQQSMLGVTIATDLKREMESTSTGSQLWDTHEKWLDQLSGGVYARTEKVLPNHELL